MRSKNVSIQNTNRAFLGFKSPNVAINFKSKIKIQDGGLRADTQTVFAIYIILKNIIK